MSLFTVYFDEFGLGMFFHAIITSTCFGMAMVRHKLAKCHQA